MTVKLVMLKSGEDIVADVKEIKSNEEVIGYYFHDPLIVKMYQPEEPKLLNEEGSTKKLSSKISISFYPWVPLSSDNKVPCSADWVITIVEPIENLKTLYEARLDGRRKNDQGTVVI
tara:strand:+ start:45 stop:395 length:351 start_codon:yes stop_codon:yes gene_type:complete